MPSSRVFLWERLKPSVPGNHDMRESESYSCSELRLLILELNSLVTIYVLFWDFIFLFSEWKFFSRLWKNIYFNLSERDYNHLVLNALPNDLL